MLCAVFDLAMTQILHREQTREKSVVLINVRLRLFASTFLEIPFRNQCATNDSPVTTNNRKRATSLEVRRDLTAQWS